MNTALQHIAPSATLALTARANALRAQGHPVLNFAAGEPDFPTPEHIRQAAAKAIEEGQTRYTPTAGTPALRKAIAEKFHRENGIAYDPSEVMACNGGKQAIYNAFLALCSPGDEIIIPSPYWLSYPEQARLVGARPVIAPTDDAFIMRADLLRPLITARSRILVLSSPGNPTGAVVPKAELRRIMDLAAEHNLWVLSDEVYEQFTYDEAPASVASFGEEERSRTLTVNAVSKTYAMTGWRLGYIGAPKRVIEAMDTIQGHATSGPCSIAQAAALAALTGPQDCVRGMREAFARRRRLMVDGLRSAGLSCAMPGGAFYAFPSVPGGSARFAQELLEKAHVAVVPGEPFGSDGHARLSYACSDETIVEGMERIRKFMGR